MKVKLVGCLVLSSIIIALAVALPIVFLLKPGSSEGSDSNPPPNSNSSTLSPMSTSRTYYSTSLNLSRTAQLPILSISTIDLPIQTTTSTISFFPTETPNPGRKKPWWHWW